MFEILSPIFQEVNEGYRRCFMRRISRIIEAMIVFFGIFPNYSDFRQRLRRCSICRINRILKYWILRRSSFCQITRITEDILRMELTVLDVGRISRIFEDVQQSWFDFPGGYQSQMLFSPNKAVSAQFPKKVGWSNMFNRTFHFSPKFSNLFVRSFPKVPKDPTST